MLLLHTEFIHALFDSLSLGFDLIIFVFREAYINDFTGLFLSSVGFLTIKTMFYIYELRHALLKHA